MGRAEAGDGTPPGEPPARQTPAPQPPPGAAAPAPPQPVLRVQVVLAPQPRQVLRAELMLPAGATLAEAVAAAAPLLGSRGTQDVAGPGAGALPAQLIDGTLQAAVWGRLRPPGTPLRDGDRVELLRALQVDPKQARRQRHARHRERLSGAGAAAAAAGTSTSPAAGT